MKANKIIILLLVLVASISFTSCVEDGDYTVPQNLGTEENTEVQKIIAELNNPNGSLDAITIKNLRDLAIDGEATRPHIYLATETIQNILEIEDRARPGYPSKATASRTIYIHAWLQLSNSAN